MESRIKVGIFKAGDRVRVRPGSGKSFGCDYFDLDESREYTVAACRYSTVRLHDMGDLYYNVKRFMSAPTPLHYLVQVGLTPWEKHHMTIDSAKQHALASMADGGEFTILEVRTIGTYRVSKPQPKPEAIPV